MNVMTLPHAPQMQIARTLMDRMTVNAMLDTLEMASTPVTVSDYLDESKQKQSKAVMIYPSLLSFISISTF